MCLTLKQEEKEETFAGQETEEKLSYNQCKGTTDILVKPILTDVEKIYKVMSAYLIKRYTTAWYNFCDLEDGLSKQHYLQD